MTHQQPHAMYPVTLVFTSVEGFLQAVQRRSITEVGKATLKRITLYDGGAFERHVSFLLLTALDHARNEILACAMYLHTADVADNYLWTPRDDWERDQAQAETVKQQVRKRLDAVTSISIVDAAYHIHPDIAMRFATLDAPKENDDEAASERL